MTFLKSLYEEKDKTLEKNDFLSGKGCVIYRVKDAAHIQSHATKSFLFYQIFSILR